MDKGTGHENIGGISASVAQAARRNLTAVPEVESQEFIRWYLENVDSMLLSDLSIHHPAIPGRNQRGGDGTKCWETSVLIDTYGAVAGFLAEGFANGQRGKWMVSDGEVWDECHFKGSYCGELDDDYWMERAGGVVKLKSPLLSGAFDYRTFPKIEIDEMALFMEHVNRNNGGRGFQEGECDVALTGNTLRIFPDEYWPDTFEENEKTYMEDRGIIRVLAMEFFEKELSVVIVGPDGKIVDPAGVGEDCQRTDAIVKHLLGDGRKVPTDNLHRVLHQDPDKWLGKVIEWDEGPYREEVLEWYREKYPDLCLAKFCEMQAVNITQP